MSVERVLFTPPDVQYLISDHTGSILADVNVESQGLPEHEGEWLRRAAERGELELVKELLERGVDPNQCDGEGMTALHHAAEFGRADVIRLLATYQPGGTRQGRSEREANDHDAGDGEEDAEGEDGDGKSAEADTPDGKDGDSDEEGDAEQQEGGEDEAERHISSHHLAVNFKDTSGWTPLMCAVEHGHEDCVVMLVNLGANIAAQNEVGRTALHLATVRQNDKMCRLLLERGAPPLSNDDIGFARVYNDQSITSGYATDEDIDTRSSAT